MEPGPHKSSSPRRSGNALPDGTRLGEFQIRGVIGEGGFGIVYLAWDGSLQRQVAIKEYMPSTLATRSSSTTDVAPRADKFAETFVLGLRSFINEAQLLASFDHPSLLKVYRFWEANGTAYMVMPYYQGTTLKRTLIERNEPPEESWLVMQIGHLLDALEVMHLAHCFHRDIAPDNILLLDDGNPLLLDFGAARRVIGDATQALTAFLKPGYAPVEQYAEMPSMKQGAWTDLYALGSVVHYAIAGHTPPESVARLVTDTMVPLTRGFAGRYSERFLRGIDHALGVRPQDRPQSVAEMRADLGIRHSGPRLRKPGDIPTAPQPLDALATVDDRTTRPPRPTTVVPPRAPVLPVPHSPQAPQAPPGRRGAAVWLAAAAVAGLALAGVWWLWPPDSATTPAQALPPAAAPPVQSAEGDASTRRSTGTVSGQPKSQPGAAQAPAADAPAPAASSELPQGDLSAAPAKPARPVAPRLNSHNPRCTEIIARVSLGEELSAAERSILQGECRK